MKIGVAQTRPVKGDVQHNIENHKKWINLAASHGANTIIFPELSITGYEPELSKELATTQDDHRFDDFQIMSDTKQITIGVGMLTISDSGILISMIIFQPHQPRQTYSKQYLHADEYPHFISGQQQVLLTKDTHKAALAICYEMSVPEHSENAFKSGAGIYIVSVAKSVSGVEKAIKTLSVIASTYSMIVVMSNSVGSSDGVECRGKTSVWNNKGLLIGQLSETEEGILIMDTDIQKLIVRNEENTIPNHSR